MGLFKEEASVLEDICRRQVIIPNGRSGVYVTKNDIIWSEVKETISNLKKAFNVKEYTRGNLKGPGEFSKTTEIFIPWEIDKDHYFGTKYKVTYHKIPGRKRSMEYISVIIGRAFQTENPFKTIK